MYRYWGTSGGYSSIQKGSSKIDTGQNFKLVTHGCGGTPVSVKITPEDGFDAPFIVPAADINGTTFKVALSGGLTLSNDANFMWEACR